MGAAVRDGWRTGAVAITGATGQVGRALQERLEPLPNRVVPLDRHADVAAGIANVEVVVHLAGTLQPRPPDTYASANRETARATAAALLGSSVQRVVFVSFLTADLRSPNPYLRSKAEAEELLADAGVPLVVLRCGHVYGPPSAPGPTASSFLARRGRVAILGPGTQRFTPIHLDDLVEAIVHAALDPTTPTGTFPLAGPDPVTADRFARVLNGDAGVRLRHLAPPVARLLGRVVPSLPAPLVDVMLRDAVAPAEVAATAATFGVHLHHLDDVWPTVSAPAPATPGGPP